MKAMLILFAATLAACQSAPPGAATHQPQQHRGPMTSAGSSSAGSATASGAGEKAGEGSWYGMCEINRRVQQARTPEERQAILAEAMPDMLPEAREHHLHMMQQRCAQQ